MNPTINVLKLTKDQERQLNALEKRYVGERVLITAKNHPYSKMTGTVNRLEYVGVMGKMGFVVDYDNGGSGFIFDAHDWRVL